jgi:hypothetical protein
MRIKRNTRGCKKNEKKNLFLRSNFIKNSIELSRKTLSRYQIESLKLRIFNERLKCLIYFPINLEIDFIVFCPPGVTADPPPTRNLN